MAAAAEDLRMKRREKDSHEHKAKELFRDMRRLFEKVRVLRERNFTLKYLI